MLKILGKQKNILEEIKSVLIEEKEVLIRNDGEALNTLVHRKTQLLDLLDESEKIRKDKYQDKKLDDIVIPINQKHDVNQLSLKIKELYKEIQEYQKINLMLTHQSIDYQNTIMNIIKETIEKSGHIYGESGKIKTNETSQTTSLNKSV